MSISENIKYVLRVQLTILLLFFTKLVVGQSSQYHIKDTISSGKIISAMSQCQNYYWIGTDKGLLRITKKTGYNKLYTSKNSGLPNNKITSICCRKNGHVWVGTSNGLILNDGFYFFWMNTENTKLPDNDIRLIVEDSMEIVWVITKTGLVKITRNNKFHLYAFNIKEVRNEKSANPTFITMADVQISSNELIKRKRNKTIRKSL